MGHSSLHFIDIKQGNTYVQLDYFLNKNYLGQWCHTITISKIVCTCFVKGMTTITFLQITPHILFVFDVLFLHFSH